MLGKGGATAFMRPPLEPRLRMTMLMLMVTVLIMMVMMAMMTVVVVTTRHDECWVPSVAMTMYTLRDYL